MLGIAENYLIINEFYQINYRSSPHLIQTDQIE